MFVKLTDDPSRAKVRAPHGGRLLPADAVLEVGDHDAYWLRRITQGDVLLVDKDGALLVPPEPQAAPAADPAPDAAPAGAPAPAAPPAAIRPAAPPAPAPAVQS